MSAWSKLPPRQAGLYYFRGTRSTHRGQTVRVNDPVRLQWIPNGKASELTVIMLGTQRRFPLTAFEGEWQAITEWRAVA